MLIAVFSIVAGLLGEAVEVARLRYAGLAMPGLGLCLTLFVVYGLAGGFAAALAAVTGGGRARQMRVAAALFAVFVIVPWANFAVLPAAGSLTSIAGTLGFAALAVALGWLLGSLPRATAIAVLVLAVVAHVPAAGRGAPQGGAETVAASGKPNLLLILVDTLRADHLGSYGYERPTSPRMDELARQGVRFERTIAQAAWTKPSVASLFTGRYVHQHGVIRNLDALGSDLPTLATLLDAAGYHTAAFSANPWITPEFRFSRGFDEFESGRTIGPQLTNLYRTVRRAESLLKRGGAPLPLSRWVFRWAGRENSGNAERDEAQARQVVEWLRDAEDKEPFFLYVHMIGPHDPYDPPPEFARAFARSAAPAPRLPPPRVQTQFETAQAMEEERLQRLVDQYDAAIAHVDSLVGGIVDELAQRGLADDTIVILTSDHGEEFYEHGNWRHGNQLYDEVVRVPLLIRVPGGPRGVVRQDPAMLIDVVPTVLSLVSVEVPADAALELAGRKLFPAPADDGQPTLSEHWWFEGGTYVAQAVGRGDLKLQSARDEASGRQEEALYDLRRDRRESRNLLKGGGQGYEEAELAALRDLLSGFGAAGIEAEAAAGESLDGLDAATRERLKALGYLGAEGEPGKTD